MRDSARGSAERAVLPENNGTVIRAVAANTKTTAALTVVSGGWQHAALQSIAACR